MVTARVPLPLKWHGGKFYLAPQIVALMPTHTHYVEPFAGGLAVMLAKDPGKVSEVANDTHGQLTNFWRVLQDERAFGEFKRIMEAVPFSEAEWQEARKCSRTGPVGQAVDFFILCRQSLAGRMAGFAPLSRTRVRRGMNEQASAWQSAVVGLPEVHARLMRVVVLNHDALAVIREEDGPGTLFYLDPPYLGATRASADVYEHELADERHEQLLALIRLCRGKVMLSGYPSDLYDRQLHGWTRHSFAVPNSASGQRRKRSMTEVVWCNF